MDLIHAPIQEIEVHNKIGPGKYNGAIIGGHPNRVALGARSKEKWCYIVGAAAPQTQLAACSKSVGKHAICDLQEY